VIDAEPVVIAVRSFMVDKGHWRGTATQLLHALTNGDRTEQCVSRWRSWPRDASAFSVRLRDAAATLRKIRITAGFGRDTSPTRNRIIELRRLDSEPRPEHLDGLDTPDTDRAQNVVTFPKKQ
jgi:hypothetical protein